METIYDKHKEGTENKGVKAHFKMDDSGILSLDKVSGDATFLLFFKNFLYFCDLNLKLKDSCVTVKCNIHILPTLCQF